MTDSNTHLESVPGTRSRDNPVESECTPRKLSRNNSGDDGGFLQPGPSGESDFKVANKKFAFSVDQLNKLLNPKNFGALGAFGGFYGLEKGLRTNVRSGLSIDETLLDDTTNFDRVVARSFVPPNDASLDESAMNQPQDRFADRRRMFGINKLPEKKLKSI